MEPAERERAAYVRVVHDAAWIGELITRLAQRAYESDLEAAHAEELIAEGAPATTEVRAALTAAVYHGIASGLRDAIDLLRDALADR
jgi:hypothetical protein